MTTLLEPGMVIAIEPKVAMPGVGAVGIEDSFVVTATGVDRLTIADQELAVVG
jgi:Xaa-Pro aminopeptidase